MRRSIRRSIAVAVVSIAISMFVSAVPAAQAAPVNCVHQTHRGACYEFVWVNGVQVRMTFPQAGQPLPHIPNAKVQNFYVIAAQTDTPQPMSRRSTITRSRPRLGTLAGRRSCTATS
jgi:hypothetical protein